MRVFNVRWLKEKGCPVLSRITDRVVKVVMILGVGVVSHGALADPLGSSTQSPVGQTSTGTLSLDALIERLHSGNGKSLYNAVLSPEELEFKRRIDSDTPLTDKQWTRVLTRTGVLRVRKLWPAELSFAISMVAPPWLEATQIRVVPEDESLQAAQVGQLFTPTCGNCIEGECKKASYQPLGVLLPGVHHLVFNITIERGSALVDPRGSSQLSAPPARIVWKGKMTFDTKVVTRTEDAFVPIISAPLETAIRHALTTRVGHSAVAPALSLEFDVNYADVPELALIGLALRVEFLRKEIVQRQVFMIPSKNTCIGRDDRTSAGCGLRASIPIHGLPGDIENNVNELNSWSVRVVGVADGLWRDWPQEERWAGEFETPLNDLIRNRDSKR